ncbi:MAG: hypothetical protein KIT22_03935 [Verrucomicrobiae bacterium]|nr:hypothetical protein [Verrucomicrobiae bacterium]
MNTLILLALVLPLGHFVAVGMLWLLGFHPSERSLSGTSRWVYGIAFAVFSLEGFLMLWHHQSSNRLQFGDWFATEHSHFGITLTVDRWSLPVLWLTSVLVGVVASFSSRYLHREDGYLRFFSLLNLFAFGAFLVVVAGSLDLLTVGWELVGITSVLLIGFFRNRPEPVRNALIVFVYYRLSDVFLIGAVLLGHLWLESVEMAELVRTPPSARATTVAVLLVLAACGKSSTGPFFGWLPRAMEGPTPSSAIFYGGISIHLGAFLLLRVQPLIAGSVLATATVLVSGALTAGFGTLLHRSSSDAKTSLSYATQTQLGLVFVEIGLGWTTIAMVHLLGHAIARTAQFLRAPSMLHEHQHVHAAAGGPLEPTGVHFETWLPRSLQRWLYRVALGAGLYETVVDRLLVKPVCAVARGLAALEPAPRAGRSPSPPSSFR